MNENNNIPDNLVKQPKDEVKIIKCEAPAKKISFKNINLN
jgi:hypothetical protein